MTNKDVKKRDVLPFNEFVKAHETALKVVMTKKDENPNPAAHDIKGEGLYSRNDANPYKAFGIPHDEKTTDINNNANANKTDVQGKVHDGQDPVEAKADKKINASDVAQKASDAASMLGK